MSEEQARRQSLDGPAKAENVEHLLGMATRRSLLTRGAAGGAALAAGGLFSGLLAEGAMAQAGTRGRGVLREPREQTPPLEIFQIAAIAEQLAVTFYSNGVQNAGALGLDGIDLAIIKAAGIEEQIHHQFFLAVISLLTGEPAPETVGPTTFSFPFPNTFTDITTFLATQQALEGVFDSAFLAAIRELSRQNQARAAQIAGQVACIESEHRALGRAIAARRGIALLPNPVGALIEGRLNPRPSNPEPNPVPTVPPNNWVFAPVFLESVGDAPALVQRAGFLSPVAGNSFNYDPIDFLSPTYEEIFERVFFREPTINLGVAARRRRRRPPTRRRRSPDFTG
jgi:hypothetical protein